VAASCEYGDEPSGSRATELVISTICNVVFCVYGSFYGFHYKNKLFVKEL
jgi:hypothetical protein